MLNVIYVVSLDLLDVLDVIYLVPKNMLDVIYVIYGMIYLVPLLSD